MMTFFEEYERAYGQVLNKDKISIFFSHNTPFDVRHMIIHISEIKVTGTTDNIFDYYLYQGDLRSKHFKGLYTKLGKELQIENSNFYRQLGRNNA